MHTVGLGGDSEVRLNDDKRLVVGPRRAVPLSLLVHENGAHLATLQAQADSAVPDEHAGRFALRLRPLDADAASLTSGERKVWQALADGPVALSELLADHHLARPLRRLADRGLVIVSAFTPSDASHVLGRHSDWNRDAAELGAALWLKRLTAVTGGAPDSAEAFAQIVFDRTVVQSGKALVSAALAEEQGRGFEEASGLAETIVTAALSKQPEDQSLLDFSIKLGQPLIAIGAPAGTYYPEVARRLGTRLIVPEHAGVTNAIGAVASGVSQTAKALITAPSEDRFRVHADSGVRDFTDLDQARSYAESEARQLAVDRARAAGADEIEVRSRRDEKIVQQAGSKDMYIEGEVVATAFGRPRLTLR